MNPGESTPLASSLPKNGLDASGIQDIASGIMTKEAVSKAGSFAKEKVDEMKRMANDGDLSIRLLALLGGLAMTVTSAMQFLGNIISFKLFSALLNVYTFLLGILVVLLESKKMPMMPRLEHNISKYALFLKYVWGRGLVYFIAGTLQLSQPNPVTIVSGTFMSIVGILYIVVGRKTANKLSELRKSLYSEHTLKAKFHESDSTGSGTLTVDEFRYLTQSLGLSLSRREIEAVFLELVKSDNGQLSYEDFRSWWAEYDDGGNQ